MNTKKSKKESISIPKKAMLGIAPLKKDRPCVWFF